MPVRGEDDEIGGTSTSAARIRGREDGRRQSDGPTGRLQTLERACNGHRTRRHPRGRLPGNVFNGAILPALENLISSGTIRVLDLLFAYRTADGEVGSIELAGLTAQYGPLFASVDGDVPGGFLDAEDVAELTDVLEPNSSIAVICWENTWAAPFLSALEGSGAVLIDQARVPRDVVLSALELAEG